MSTDITDRLTTDEAARVEAFKADLIAVCLKHNLSLSCDSGGPLVVYPGGDHDDIRQAWVGDVLDWVDDGLCKTCKWVKDGDTYPNCRLANNLVVRVARRMPTCKYEPANQK